MTEKASFSEDKESLNQPKKSSLFQPCLPTSLLQEVQRKGTSWAGLRSEMILPSSTSAAPEKKLLPFAKSWMDP